MKVERGDKVLVRYTGRLDSGDVFDSNLDDAQPLEFLVGSGQVIAGFDGAVLGLAEGEARTVRIPAADAYGERDERLVTRLDRNLFGEDGVGPGQHLELEDEGGNVYHADVVAVDDEGVTVDLNHHLAGQALTFEVRVEAIERT